MSGTASVYQKFWENRLYDLKAYPPGKQKKIAEYLTQQVFGAPSTGDDSDEDHDMQLAFDHAMQQEILASATKKDDEEDEEAGGRGEGSGNKVEDGEDDDE